MLSPGPELLLSTEGSYRAGYGNMSVILALEGAGRRVKVAKSACVTACQPRLQGTISEKEKEQANKPSSLGGDDEDHTEDAPGRGRQVRGPHSHLFLFSSSAMSCLCCLLASKLKLASAGGRVYGGEKLFVFFPPKFKYPESETVNFFKKKSFFEVLFAYHKTHPTQQSYHI